MQASTLDDLAAQGHHRRALARAAWRRWALRYFAVGLTVTLLMLGGKLLVEATPMGDAAGLATRSLLLKLLPVFRDRGADAIVLDISHLAGGTRDPKTGDLVATSRIKLRELLDVLVALRPAAIGIDIDFGATLGGWVDPRDPEFLDHCLRLNEQGVPVRVGVARSLGARDKRWLSDPRFAPLAGAVYLGEPDTGRVPVWIENEATGDRLMTLGASLAAATQAARWGPLYATGDRASLNSLLFDNVVTRRVREGPVEFVAQTHDALLNFSVIRQQAREYVPQVQPGDLVKYAERLQGRVVLIGDMAAVNDRYAIPGDRINRPGVLLHAAQVHTFTSEPLFEFGHGFRILMDLALPVLVMVVVAVRRYLGAGAAVSGHAASHGATSPQVLLRLLMLAVVLVALGLAAFFRIFWPDFLLLVFFLALHHPTEHQLLGALQRRWGIAS